MESQQIKNLCYSIKVQNKYIAKLEADKRELKDTVASLRLQIDYLKTILNTYSKSKDCEAKNG